MKIGFFGFNNGVLAESEAMAQAVQAMDDAGFESAWTGERVLLVDPQEPPSPMPPGFPMLGTVRAGLFTRISGVRQQPMPIQQPHPPIVIGGMSPPAYRRAVRQGNGWYGFAQTVEAAAASVAGLKEAAAVEARPAGLGELEVTVTPPGPVDADALRQHHERKQRFIERLSELPCIR